MFSGLAIQIPSFSLCFYAASSSRPSQLTGKIDFHRNFFLRFRLFHARLNLTHRDRSVVMIADVSMSPPDLSLPYLRILPIFSYLFSLSWKSGKILTRLAREMTKRNKTIFAFDSFKMLYLILQSCIL